MANNLPVVSRAKAASLPPLDPAGTDAAKQDPEMLDPQAQKKTEANLAGANLLPTAIADPAARVAKSGPGMGAGFSDQPADPGGFTDAETPKPDGQVVAGDLVSFSQPIHSVDPTTHSQAAKVTPVFHAITDTLERLQTDGHTNVEMQLKLADGQQLTVRLQLHAGELRATFRTDSHDWREAITRGWSDFSSNAADRGLRITNPVFEAPSAQPGFHDFERQSNQRQQPGESSPENQGFRLPSPQKKASQPLSAGASSAAPVARSARRTSGLAAWA